MTIDIALIMIQHWTWPNSEMGYRLLERRYHCKNESYESLSLVDVIVIDN